MSALVNIPLLASQYTVAGNTVAVTGAVAQISAIIRCEHHQRILRKPLLSERLADESDAPIERLDHPNDNGWDFFRRVRPEFTLRSRFTA